MGLGNTQWPVLYILLPFDINRLCSYLPTYIKIYIYQGTRTGLSLGLARNSAIFTISKPVVPKNVGFSLYIKNARN